MDNTLGLGFLRTILESTHSINTSITSDESLAIDVTDLHVLLLKGCQSNQSFKVPWNQQNSLLLSPHLFDRRFHFDFTKTDDKRKKFHRGGEIYTRPCGWKRFALKVDGRYSDDNWLLGKGKRRNKYSSCSEEWAVSYHGTSYNNNGLCIADEGYELSKGAHFEYGQGIYSTPDINVASKYADTFQHIDGKKYKFVIQNRVNPKNLIKVDGNAIGEYWISPSKIDIRPYGFCFKEC